MDSGFSGTIRISNIDDYIAPSQNCIKPIVDRLKTVEEKADGSVVDKPNSSSVGTVSKPVSVATGASNQDKVQLTLDNMEEAPLSQKPETESVQITLNDCLACSGCVTTAESILIEQQSYKALENALKLNKHTVFVSVSPQSIASLAAHKQCATAEALSTIAYFLINKGVKYILSTSFTRVFALLASAHEFVEGRSENKDRTLFASVCPGWICFAEKTHGDTIIPYLSGARSPQAVAGSLVKSYLASKFGLKPSQVYHASVMPCFDKKLEASRSQLRWQENDDSMPETDCVISTAELNEWMELDCANGVGGDDVCKEHDSQLIKSIWPPCADWSDVVRRHEGGGSGGYAHFVLKFAARALFGINDCQYTINKVNKDLEELILHDPSDSSKTLLRFARAYGFRNIQNLMLKMKRQKMKYDYVEVMACPSGCLNGGGQIRARLPSERTALLHQVEANYNAVPDENPECQKLVEEILKEWLGDNAWADDRLKTSYNALPVNIGAQIRW